MNATRAQAEHRWAVCYDCPAYRPALGRCAHCGCIMRFKVWFDSAVCPEGRW